MKNVCLYRSVPFTTLVVSLLALSPSIAQDALPSSYAPVVQTQSFDSIVTRMRAAKAGFAAEQAALLKSR